MTVEQVAEVCHEANRALCSVFGDSNQKLWGEAEQWQRESATSGVRAHLAALAKGQALSPSWSHDIWMKEKLLTGWTWGPVKDAEKKTHPSLVPYNDLPVRERLKDFLFGAIVEALSRDVE